MIDKLAELGMEPTWRGDLQNFLTNVEAYLKSDYSHEVALKSHCASQCIFWALFDPKKKEFQETCDPDHEDKCELCKMPAELFQHNHGAINHLQQAMTEDQYEEFHHDLDQVAEASLTNQCHLLRIIAQEHDLKEGSNARDPIKAHSILDWSMKFLDRRNHES